MWFDRLGLIFTLCCSSFLPSSRLLRCWGAESRWGRLREIVDTNPQNQKNSNHAKIWREKLGAEVFQQKSTYPLSLFSYGFFLEISPSKFQYFEKSTKKTVGEPSVYVGWRAHSRCQPPKLASWEKCMHCEKFHKARSMCVALVNRSRMLIFLKIRFCSSEKIKIFLKLFFICYRLLFQLWYDFPGFFPFTACRCFYWRCFVA